MYIYPSANNCSNFLVCLHHEEYEFSCLLAPLFGYPDKKVCTESCASVNNPTKKFNRKQKSKNADTDLHPDEPARSIICPREGEAIARILQSCTDYISCKNGIATKLSCPNNQEFSPTELSCMEKSEAKCTILKQKTSHHFKCRYNFSKKKLYFASDTCGYFQKCLDNGMAVEEKCAENTSWDPKVGGCELESFTKCSE